MSTDPMRAVAVALLVALSSSCRRPSTHATPTTRPSASATTSVVPEAASHDAAPEASVVAKAEPRPIGPFATPFLGKRDVWFVVPALPKKGHRLLVNLHGVCNPPGYACGHWADTGATFGFLVCPTGDGSCGPAMYDAPTWTESEAKMDGDLEAAIAKVETLYPDEITREGAVLTGFSRGAYVGARIASMHPGRWPYLVLIEADVKLSVPALRTAKVRAVALIAGELGSQVAGERATAKALEAQGFPAKLWVMPKAGHHYSSDIGEIMREALEWVTSH